jgi:hypothetical protein
MRGAMNVLKTIFSIQSKRLFTKRNLFVFLVIGLILILLVQDGKNKYLTGIENIKEFQAMEAEKVNFFLFYDQYAYYGIKILFIPSPFIILQSDSLSDEIIANLNIAERLNISTYLNQNFSDDNSGYTDFFGILLIFSVICGLFFGFEITINEDYSRFLYRQNTRRDKFLISVISTIILLSIAFIILIGICLLWLLVNGLNLFNRFIFIIVLEVIVNISFFIAVGTVIGGLNKKKSTRRTILLLLIIGSIFFIPWVTTKVNQKIVPEIESISKFEFVNFKLLMEAEKRIFNKIGTYKNDGNIAPENIKKIVENDKKGFFKEIMENENKRKEKILNLIRLQQTILSIFPVTSSIAINKEISSCGGVSYLEFLSYSKSVKVDFRNFILFKKFYEGAAPGKVEPFISKNVFYGKSHLPFNFWLGVFLTPFYAVLLLFFSLRILKKRMKIPKPTKAYQVEQEKDNPLFVLCENVSIKEDIFNYYQNQKAVCLKKINTDDFMFNGVKAHELLKHLSALNEVDKQKALENMGIMGIKDLTGLPLCHEITSKIIVAVKTAADFDLIVLNDLVKNEPRELERDIFNLLLSLEKSGKKIIYLSCDMKQSPSVNSFDDKIKVHGFETFPLNLSRTNLR